MDDLSKAVEGTISSTLAEAGHLLDGFVGIVNFIDPEGARCWTVVAPDQFLDRSYSMADYLSRYFEMQRDLSLTDYFLGRDDDDD